VHINRVHCTGGRTLALVLVWMLDNGVWGPLAPERREAGRQPAHAGARVGAAAAAALAVTAVSKVVTAIW